MNECPHGGCKDITKMVKKNTLLAILGSVIIPIVLAVAIAWGATQSRIDKVITDEAVLEKAVELGFGNLTEVLTEFKKDFNRRLDKMEANQVTIPDVHREITKRLHDRDK